MFDVSRVAQTLRKDNERSSCGIDKTLKLSCNAMAGLGDQWYEE